MAMVGERVRVDQSFKSKTSIVAIHILVVDDDATSLAIVSAMLRTLKYEGTLFWFKDFNRLCNLASCFTHNCMVRVFTSLYIHVL